MTYAWLAGFFDGEGCINIAKPNISGRTHYQLIIDVSQKKRKVLDEIREFVGFGKVSSKRGAYAYRCASLQAEKFIKGIMPYLRIKILQARLALQFMKYKKQENPLSKKEIKWRHMHYKLMQLYKL